MCGSSNECGRVIERALCGGFGPADVLVLGGWLALCGRVLIAFVLAGRVEVGIAQPI